MSLISLFNKISSFSISNLLLFISSQINSWVFYILFLCFTIFFFIRFMFYNIYYNKIVLKFDKRTYSTKMKMYEKMVRSQLPCRLGWPFGLGDNTIQVVVYYLLRTSFIFFLIYTSFQSHLFAIPMHSFSSIYAIAIHSCAHTNYILLLSTFTPSHAS